jgi:mRNA export factor
LCHAAFEPAPGPISACAFSNNGAQFAYAVSYDWSKGHAGAVQGHPNKVFLHAVKEPEAKKRGVKR